MGEESQVMPSVDAARNRLLVAIPYFRNAVAQANSKGKMMLGILSLSPDGSGKIEAQFEAFDFFNDIATVIGASPQTEEDDANAEALGFLDRHGLRNRKK